MQLSDQPKALKALKACKATLIAGLAFFGLYATSVSAQMNAAESIKPLLLEAIKKGHAKGEMGGQARDVIVRLFNSTAPILVNVERLHPLETAGCFRLQVTTSQTGVYEVDPKTRVRDSAPSDKKIAYQVSYCANGFFPEEGGGL